MNDENLKKGNPETQFRSGRQAVENGKKGGTASGKARKKKADIKRVIQSILSETYTDKEGIEKTGEEILGITLFKVATNPKHRQWRYPPLRLLAT